MMTLTAEPMKDTTPMNTLAAQLINEHEAKRWWSTTERIELTFEQADELRKGVIDGRCAWGIVETSQGRIRWMVLQELCASREGVREGHVLRYHLTKPPIPKEKPNELLDSIASGYALNSVQSNEQVTYLTETQGNMKLEAWVVPPEQEEATRKHWKRLKNAPQLVGKKKQPKRLTTRIGTYTITATTIIARLGKEIDPAQEPYCHRHNDGKYYLLDYMLEEVLCLETEEEQQLESLIEKREEWRKDYAVLLYEVVKNGKRERYQYKYVAGEGRGKRGGWAWVSVEQFQPQDSHDKARLVLY